MADIVDPATRSRMMSGIRASGTGIEVLVGKALHRAGFRYRKHVKTLPGRPDLVFRRYRAVVFVDGCFWHKHSCSLFKMPKTRVEFWVGKIEGNRQRDQRNEARLIDDGWRVARVWECALRGKREDEVAQVVQELAAWLESTQLTLEIPKGTAQ